jgi:hypothetical protein
VRKISKFLWESGFILPIVCFVLALILIAFPIKQIPIPKNPILHTIWQLSVFVLRPGLFLLPGIGLTIVLIILHLGAKDGDSSLKEIWKRS